MSDEQIDLRGSQGSVVNPGQVTQVYEGRQSLEEAVYRQGLRLADVGADLARLDEHQATSEAHNERRAEDVKAVVLQVLDQVRSEVRVLRDEMRSEFVALRAEMARLPRRRRYTVFSVAWLFLVAPTPFFFQMFVR